MKHAFRSLRRSPGYASVIILTLALGIGANTAIFSFFRGILLRPLPYDDPKQVVALATAPDHFADPVGTEVGLFASDFRELRPNLRSFAESTTYTLDSATVMGRGPATLVSTAIVTTNFFSVLGSHAIVGRTFSAADTANSTNRLATISHAYWKNQLGGDTAVIGQTITINRVPFTIVGVMAADFALPREAQIWVTPAADIPENAIGQPLDFAGRGNYVRTLLGRLAPGVSLAQAEHELAPLLRALPNPNRVQRAVHLVNLRDYSVGEVRPALAILLACVGLVLLIACLNVANLMLSRAIGREREISIRLALGAGRWRIAQHLLSESLLLALMSGAVGVLLSLWALDGLVRIAPADIPRLSAVEVDGWVLGFALLASVLTGVVSGLAPILGTTRSDLVTAIKSGDRGGSAGIAPRRLRASLVAGEVAISLVLLVAASLLIRSLGRMEAFSWGFRPEHIVSARVSFLDERYNADSARISFYRTLRDKFSTAPAMESFGISFDRIGVSWICLPFTAQGETFPNPADRPQANYHVISPGYFRTLNLALRQGREFTEHDDASTPRAVLIDAELARRHYAGGDAVGKTLKVVTPLGDTDVLVIGVVSAVKSDGPVGLSRPDIYFSYLQYPQNNFFVHVRTPLNSGAAEAVIRNIVRELDADVPVTDFASMEQVTAKPATARRFPLGLLGGFAALALVLAVIGIYAVTNYSVAQRTREIGVRMALGAPSRSVVGLMLRQSFRPIVVGLGTGLVGAALTAFAMRKLLFGVTPLDVPTFLLVPLGLTVIAAVACLLPARRATRVDPVIALRAE